MRCCGVLFVLTFLGLVAASSSVRSAEALKLFPEGVEMRSFRGNTGVVRVFSEDTGISAYAAPTYGGRVVFYGIEGDNLLWLPTRTSAAANDFTGYQLDLGPELRGIPPHPVLSTGQYRSDLSRDFTATLRSLPDPLLGVQLIKEIVIDPESGDLGVSQTITNVSPQKVSFCHWDRTAVQPGGYVIVPLAKKSRFKEKWAMLRDEGGKSQYDGDAPESERVDVNRGFLYAKAAGEPTRIGLDSDAGWIAYAWRHFLFVKYFPHYRSGEYTDGGCTVKVSWNERFAELGVVSPEVKLDKGESYRFPELWRIVELKDEVKSFKDARKAARKVPNSPFGR